MYEKQWKITERDKGVFVNPVINADYPDPDIIRVGNAFYMTSTSMHFSPGVPVMKSLDLVNWEIVSYVYHTFEDNDELSLRNGKEDYGRGSWATSLSHNNGTFYVSFACNTTGHTYIYRTNDIEKGIWTKNVIDYWFHDGSILFDDDGTPYMLYGSGSISAARLNPGVTGIAEGGSPVKIIPNADGVVDNNNFIEATHAYKVGEYYYIFFCTWPRGGTKTQVVYRSKELMNPEGYEGKLILNDKMGKGTGAGQGGIIDMPDGSWYAFVMHDRGAVGRGVTAFPMTFEDGWPVFGSGDLTVPLTPKVPVSGDFERKTLFQSYGFEQWTERPSYTYTPAAEAEGETGSGSYNGSNLKPGWEWNHNPDNRFWSLTDRPGFLRLTNGSVAENLTRAKNVLTYRTAAPLCSGTIAMEVGGMKEGDIAGFAAFQRKYGYVGVKCQGGQKYIIFRKTLRFNDEFDNNDPWEETLSLSISQNRVYFRIEFDFTEGMERVYFYYSLDNSSWTQAEDFMQIRYIFPRHFTGYRFALFNMASAETGGYVDFDYFDAQLSLPSAQAVNPFLPLWEYIPDGEPYVFEDPDNRGKYRVYIYGSHDILESEYCGRDQVVWSAPTENLNDWRYDGVCFKSDKNRDGVPFERADRLYAPDIAEVTGKDGAKSYYFYPNTQARGRSSMIARSHRPDGPFTVCNWSDSDPNRTEGVLGFDPAVFADDDGRVYGYWGFKASFAAELDPSDMASVKPGTQQINHMIPNQKMDDEGLDPQHFRFYEASSLRKIGGKYVFIYSRMGRQDERYGIVNSLLAYAYSDSPLGPWTYGGVILDNAKELQSSDPSNNTHNNHGSICEINGQWYIFYHRCTNNHGFSRQACAEPIEVKVNPDGSVYISEVEHTSQGLSAGGLNPYRKYPAGIACYLTGSPWIKANRSENINAVTEIKDGGCVGYKYFAFDTDMPGKDNTHIILDIIPAGAAGTVEVWSGRPGNEGGDLIASMTISEEMPQRPLKLFAKTGALHGKMPIFLKFLSDSPDANICELLYISFTSAPPELPPMRPRRRPAQ